MQKFIFHVDINKTIIASDLAGGKTTEDILIHILAEHYQDTWDTHSTQPISYSDYIKQYVLPGDKHDAALKKKRNQKISGFLTYLQETHHALWPIVQERYAKLCEKLQKNPSIIFPSFFNLIHYFQEKDIPFSIILRTFGKDLNEVMQEIDRVMQKPFFEWRGQFKENTLEITMLANQEKIILDTPEHIYEFFKSHGHGAIQDDWHWWNNHQEKAEYGKLFPIDLNHQQVFSFFFDDNANDTIVNPRDAQTGNHIALDQLKYSFMGQPICVVNTLHAIENDRYFIDHIIPPKWYGLVNLIL